MTAAPDQPEEKSELREGTSDDIVPTPDDFPAEYSFGSGKISDYSRNVIMKKLPEPDENETVLNTAADPDKIQVLYLREEGNVPARTKLTENMTGYFDQPEKIPPES